MTQAVERAAAAPHVAGVDVAPDAGPARRAHPLGLPQGLEPGDRLLDRGRQLEQRLEQGPPLRNAPQAAQELRGDARAQREPRESRERRLVRAPLPVRVRPRAPALGGAHRLELAALAVDEGAHADGAVGGEALERALRRCDGPEVQVAELDRLEEPQRPDLEAIEHELTMEETPPRGLGPQRARELELAVERPADGGTQ